MSRPGPGARTTAPSPLDPGTQFLVLALSIMALAQGVLLLVAGHGVTRVIGLGLAIASLNVRLRVLAVLAVLIILNGAVHISGIDPPVPYRVWYVALLAMYAAIGLAALPTLAFRVNAARAFIVTGTLALALIAMEAVIGRYFPVRIVQHATWIGRRQPHPTLGEVYEPYSVMKTVYPDNPRGFFDDAGPSAWRLDIHDAGSAASLERPPDRPEVMRIQIARAQNPLPSNIQLTELRLGVKAGESYNLTFRARADQPRRIVYGLGMGHAPWLGLGPGGDVEIGDDWREFSSTSTVAANDDRARLYFNVGQNTPSVELAHIVLRRLPGGEAVRPPATNAPAPANRYSLTYQFNAYGCRGRDYSTPGTAGTRRILALGGGETLGVGVHEWETYPARLEQALNAAAAPSGHGATEVINCGAEGYAAREKREFYEQVAERYQPDVVLLSMTAEDNISPRDARRLGYVHDVSTFEQLLLSDHLFQLWRYEWRAPTVNFSASLQEAVKLAEAARSHQARLAVVFFRTGPAVGAWAELLKAASTTLTGAGIPFLDLGPAMARAGSPDALAVHRTDPHPNEMAQRIAAKEIVDLLRFNHLVD